jgi:2-aminobenzoate-CoA ligase
MRLPPADFDAFAKSLLPPTDSWPVFDYSAEHLRHYPERLNASAALLDSAVVDGLADKDVLYYGDAAWTYGQLLDRVQRIANVLTSSFGVRPGQCVLLRSANSPMLAACWLAVVRVGAIAVAGSPMLRTQELAFMIDKLHIRMALCDVEVAKELEAVRATSQWLHAIAHFTDLGAAADARADLDHRVAAAQPSEAWTDTAADDIAAVVFTSGTTGTPKAVAHFHQNLLAACDCWRYPVPIDSDEVMCSTSGMAFTYGLTSNLLYPLRYRAAAVLLAKPTPELLLAAIERRRIAALCTVPTFLHRLLPLLPGHDVSSLRKCFSSGEPLRRELWHAWRDATGVRIVEGFGSSELLTRVLSPAASGEPVGSLGKAVPGYTVCLVDEAGRMLPPGKRGFLAVRGPTGCRYLGDPDRQRAFVRSGWNVTGDLFEEDDDGCFWYLGRKDDIIVSSGYNIAADEVERAIAEHPWVQECAVVGVPDPHRGMLVRACVVLLPGRAASEQTARDIQEHVKSAIAPYKYPRDVRFLDQLPRTASGKVERYRLRQL